MYSLFLDDDEVYRHPPAGKPPVGDQWVIARTMEQAKTTVLEQGFPAYVSFDHDLGPGSEAIDFVHWLINLDMDEREKVAPDTRLMFSESFDFWVHSANPIGRENIQCLLSGYLNFIAGGDYHDRLYPQK